MNFEPQEMMFANFPIINADLDAAKLQEMKAELVNRMEAINEEIELRQR